MKSYEHLLSMWNTTKGYWHRELKFKTDALEFGYSQKCIEIFMTNWEELMITVQYNPTKKSIPTNG